MTRDLVCNFIVKIGADFCSITKSVLPLTTTDADFNVH